MGEFGGTNPPPTAPDSAGGALATTVHAWPSLSWVQG